MEPTVSARAVTEVFEWLSALVSRQKVKGKPLKSVRDLNYARGSECERASEVILRVHGHEEDGNGSSARRRESSHSVHGERKKDEQGKRERRRYEPAQEDGEFMEISCSKTVMHVSPISVTERLLATFCPRDNSFSFFTSAPISQLKNYSREVGLGNTSERGLEHFGTWRTCGGDRSLGAQRVDLCWRMLRAKNTR